jgi:hypothetical protein
MRTSLLKIAAIILLTITMVSLIPGCGSSKATLTASMTPTVTTTNPTTPTPTPTPTASPSATPSPTPSLTPTPTPTPTNTPVEPDYAGAIAEEILQAINSGDYDAYSRHFDEAMKQAATEAVFQQSRNQIQAIYGEYISKTFSDVQENVQGIYTIVYYNTVFSKKSGVLKVVFQKTGDTVYVSGVWLN